MMNRLGTGNSQIKHRLGLKPQKQVTNTGFPLKGGDARLKLIQKKRQNITDARDVLSGIAKQGDARHKLNKMKQIKTGPANGVQKTINRPVPLMQQKIINRPVPLMQQKISMSTERVNLNKFVVQNEKPLAKIIKPTLTKRVPGKIVKGLEGRTSMKAGSLMRTVNRGQRPVARATNMSSPSSLTSGDRYHPLPSNPNLVTIINEKVVNPIVATDLQRSSQPKLKAKRILRPMSSSQGPYPPRRNIPDQPIMKTFKGNTWQSQPFPVTTQQAIKPTRLKITTANNYMDYDVPHEEESYRTYSPPPIPVRAPAQKRSYESYEYMPSPVKKPPVLSSNIISRLDAPQRLPQEYKVVVTNLHPVVSREDVKELFQNIGQIKDARIVRDGIAEVLFLNEDDAYRSVEVYHNRQLDGQTMNVSVVSKNSFPSSPPPPSAPRYSPPQDNRFYRPNSPPRLAPLRKPALMGPSSMQSYDAPDDGHPTKSVLRTAGGSTQRSYNTSLSSMLNKRSPKVDVAPDIGAIHHALFSGKNSNSDPSLQVYIKLPKPPLRANK